MRAAIDPVAPSRAKDVSFPHHVPSLHMAHLQSRLFYRHLEPRLELLGGRCVSLVGTVLVPLSWMLAAVNLVLLMRLLLFDLCVHVCLLSRLPFAFGLSY